MTRYERLRVEAKAAALHRGHNLTSFTPYPSDHSSGRAGRAACRTCRAWVVIDTRPFAATDVGGPAVARGCPATPYTMNGENTTP
jgi:hypothetical protein